MPHQISISDYINYYSLMNAYLKKLSLNKQNKTDL